MSPPNDREPVRIGVSPPPPIAERPGVSPPSPDAQWVEGYWQWDAQSKDFVWVTGTWQVPPPGKFWVNGFWRRDDRGWYRVPGFWCSRRNSQTPATGSSPGPAPEPSTPVDRTAPARIAPPADATTHTAARPVFNTPAPSENTSQPLPSPAPSAATALSPAPAVVATTPVVTTSPAVVALADQLAGQAAAFEQVFGRTARITPQGGAFLADARHLRVAALGLRQAAQAGDTMGMVRVYSDIAATWRRMIDRANWIAPGHTGPNVQQIWRMGETTSQIGRSLP